MSGRKTLQGRSTVRKVLRCGGYVLSIASCAKLGIWVSCSHKHCQDWMINDDRDQGQHALEVLRTLPGTNMEVENGPLEDHFPLQTVRWFSTSTSVPRDNNSNDPLALD